MKGLTNDMNSTVSFKQDTHSAPRRPTTLKLAKPLHNLTKPNVQLHSISSFTCRSPSSGGETPQDSPNACCNSLSLVSSVLMLLTTRAAGPTDLDIVYRWANDPVTRSMSFHSEEIAYTDHVNWFTGRLGGDKQLMIIVENSGTPCAFVRLDPDLDPDDALIGINVAPEFRGKGLGISSLNAAAAVALAHNYRRIVALIRPDNAASLKAFERAGYTPEGVRNVNGVSAQCLVLQLS